MTNVLVLAIVIIVIALWFGVQRRRTQRRLKRDQEIRARHLDEQRRWEEMLGRMTR